MCKEIREQIQEKAKNLGYLDCGFADVSPFNEHIDKLKERMKAYPQAADLYQGLIKRTDPRIGFPDVKSLIVCIWQKGQYRVPAGVDKYIGKTYLFSGGLGYRKYSEHYSARKEFQAFLSQLDFKYKEGGVPERWAAVRAGVGNFARNNFIYTEAGSYIQVETWRVDHELSGDNKENKIPCPPGCNRCIKACPTKALEAPFMMNWSMCIPYLTFHARGITPLELREKLGERIYGCDVCQDVCPLNKGKSEGKKDYPHLQEVASLLNPVSLLTMDEKTFKEEIFSRFSKTEDFSRWQMNAVRALGNTGDVEYRDLIKKALDNKDERVRVMAEWALERIR